jgi:hypothetical protein
MTRLIPTSALDSRFPFASSTLHSGKSRGRYPWLTRHGPDGHRGRILWILVDDFNQFCRDRGIKYQLEMEGRQH